MSCFCIPKKLKNMPSSSKKAWKSFTSSVSPKLYNLYNNLKLPKSVTIHARRLLNLRQGRRPFTGSARELRQSYKEYKYEYRNLQESTCNSPATVHVDRLFGDNNVNSSTYTEASSSSSHARGSGGGSSTSSGSNNNTENKNGATNSKNGQLKWRDYVARLPVIRGVDERAEEFISRFRDDMQLQREQSLLEFQEMLARST